MNISKKIIISFFILTSFSFNFFGQGEFISLPENQGTVSESQASIGSDDIPFTVSETNASESPKKSNTFFLFLRMFLVLAVVIACIYGVLYLLRRSMKTNPKNTDPFLRNVSSIDLAVGKSVHVVTLLDHAYVVGVADNSVSLISEIDSSNEKDKELINAMNLYADEHQNVKKPKSFADVLEIFMPNGPKEKGGIFGDSQKNMSKNMNNQRNKLNGGE